MFFYKIEKLSFYKKNNILLTYSYYAKLAIGEIEISLSWKIKLLLEHINTCLNTNNKYRKYLYEENILVKLSSYYDGTGLGKDKSV